MEQDRDSNDILKLIDSPIKGIQSPTRLTESLKNHSNRAWLDVKHPNG
jgi:hypothetical protein